MKARLKAALRTNEPQFSACAGLTVVNLGVCISHGAPWWFTAAFALFWPVLAFIGNLFDPIP